jgi:hypothetical protein
MALDFAAAEARLGASTLARLSNATLTLASSAVVTGMLRSAGREAYVGMGMDAREIEFACALGDVVGLAEDAAVTLAYRGTSSSLRIGRRLPDDVHLGHAVFELKKAS